MTLLLAISASRASALNPAARYANTISIRQRLVRSRDVLQQGFATGRRPKVSRGSRQARSRREKKPAAEGEENNRKLTKAEREIFSKATRKKKTKEDQKIWSDDSEKLWDYRKQWMPEVAKRAAPLIAFGCLITYFEPVQAFYYRYVSPLQMEMLYGASMLPTIHPYGDTWLHTTALWDTLRKPYHILKELITGKPSLMYHKGDIVVYVDPEQNRRTCKRITGVEGDTVQRYGEHADYYSHRSDLGIRWETLMARGVDPSCPWDEGKPELEADDHKRTLVVPEGHVWLEGDNPLVCVDSRHYGPVQVSLLEGRLFWRLFPLLREAHIRKYDQMLRLEPRVRPPPLDVEKPRLRGEEDVLAAHYNLYRIEKRTVAPKADETQSDLAFPNDGSAN